MPKITPIINIFFALLMNVFCNPMDDSLQMNTIRSNTAANERFHTSLGISDLHKEAFVPPENPSGSHPISDLVTSGQNSLGRKHSSSMIDEYKGKKLFTFDLNIPFDSQGTVEEDREPKRVKINNHRETNEHFQEVESPPSDHCQYSSSSHSMGLSSEKNEHSRVREKASDCRNRVLTESQSLTTEKIPSNSQQALQPISLDDSCYMDQSGSSKILHQGPTQFQKYRFKKSGASVMLPDHKVRVIENIWYNFSEIKDRIFNKMVFEGRQVASQTGLRTGMTIWFRDLKRCISEKHVNLPIFQGNSRTKIFMTVTKAFRQVTLVFLGSLQVIHSAQEQEMQKLTRDGWAFIVNYMKVWRGIDLKHHHSMTMAIKPENLEVENPYELWRYLMGLARSSRISLIVVWRLCDHWYHLTSYKNKMKIQTHHEFLERWYEHLAKANSLTDWEIEPLGTILSSGQSGLEINMKNKKSSLYKLLRKENFSVSLGKSKRFVTILKGVGEDVLDTLNLSHSPLESIQTYCEKMKNKNLQFSPEWNKRFDSLKHRTMSGILPCFLGMIHLLHPMKVSKKHSNPAVLDAFQFMKEFLKGWGKDDLERSFKINPREIKRLATSDEPSRVLLAYLMNLTTTGDTRVASGVYWGLFQLWKRWNGTAFLDKNPVSEKIDFESAIQKAYGDYLVAKQI